MNRVDTGLLKEQFGDQAAEIIATGMGIERWNSRKQEGLCPFHSENTPSFKWSKKYKRFKCFGCGRTLDIIDYYMQIEHKTFFEAVEACGGTVQPLEGIRPSVREKKTYTKPSYSVQDKLSQVEQYMAVRKISPQTLDYAQVKEDYQGNIVFVYRNPQGEVELVKYRPARKVQKGEHKCWSEKNGRPILYGMHQIDPSKPVLICEGEIDRLAAIEGGYPNAVSVPLGANNYQWVEECWEWLDTIDQFILWFDHDEAGQKAIRHLVPRLGEGRCSIVHHQCKDINLLLYQEGPSAVLSAINNAQMVPVEGVISLAEVEELDIYQTEKITSGIDQLDQYIGGFVLGTVDIVTGINSSGKSTFLNQALVCEAINQGYRTFIYSGELTNAQLRAWIEYPLAGPKHIQPIEQQGTGPKGYVIDEGIREQMRSWYQDKLYVCQVPRVNADSLLEMMSNVAKRYGVKNFIIDNLMMVDLECDYQGELRAQKSFVLRLKEFATKFQTVVHLVAHPRKVEGNRRLTKQDVAGSGDITNLADYVIAVHRVTPAEKEPMRNRKGEPISTPCLHDCLIDLFKNRPLGHQDKTIGLLFDYPSKRFYSRRKSADWEYSWKTVEG